MEHIEVIHIGRMNQINEEMGCGECQTSCQSACKTSCTVGSQPCESTLKAKVDSE